MTIRRGKRGRETVEVSLFPFLAVLLCTMGILIMFLVLIGQNTAEHNELASVQSTIQDVQVPKKSTWEENLFHFPDTEPVENVELEKNITAPDEDQPVDNEAGENSEKIQYEETRRTLGDLNLEELQTEVESASWFRGELEQVRTRTNESLKTERDKLSQTETQIARLTEHLADLETQLAILQEESVTENIDLQEIENVKSEIEALNSDIEELKNKIQSQGENHSYAILPYKGKNGTFRRPIYIECGSAGVTLMPEHFFFPMGDLLLGRFPGNPFDTGLRTARQYYIEIGEGSEEDEPYPLLIVRPGSSESYYAARSALASWGGECGYEFIEEDAEIEYPAASPELARRIQDQVVVARQRLAGALALLLEQRRQQAQSTIAKTGSGSGNRGFGNSAGSETGSLAGQLGPYARLSADDSDSSENSREEITTIYSGRDPSGIDNPSIGFNSSANSDIISSANIQEMNQIKVDTGTAQDISDELYVPLPDTSGYGIDGYGICDNDHDNTNSMDVTDSSTYGSHVVSPGRATFTAAADIQNAPPTYEGGASQNSSMQYESAPTTDIGQISAESTLAYNQAFPGNTPTSLTDKIASDSAQQSSEGSSDGEINPSMTLGNTAYRQSELEQLKEKDLTRHTPENKPDHEPVKSTPLSEKAFNLNDELSKPTDVAVERPITVECHPDRIVFPHQAGVARRTEIELKEGCEEEILRTIVTCVQSWKAAGRNRYWTPWIYASVAPQADVSYERLARLMIGQKVKIKRATDGKQ